MNIKKLLNQRVVKQNIINVKRNNQLIKIKYNNISSKLIDLKIFSLFF
jgi:hypothetical protein